MSDDRPDLSRLQDRLGYRFQDQDLLVTALTHRSYAHEAGQAGEAARHYERLEFLGDALLGFLASRLLYDLDPEASEGVLTRRKSMVVRTETLAEAAERIGIMDSMRLRQGERDAGVGANVSLLADGFESVLGAVYLDGGIRKAAAFVRRHLKEAIRTSTSSEQVREDYKTRFQERIQSELRITPEYRIVSSTGPDHRQVFRAVVRVGSETAGSGEGASRKKAEQAAARDALNHWMQQP